jgi:hypothetical protein
MGDQAWNAEVLAAMPPELIHDLRDATVAAEYDRLLFLVDKLEATSPRAAQELRRLVHSFDYQSLLDMLEGEKTP